MSASYYRSRASHPKGGLGTGWEGSTRQGFQGYEDSSIGDSGEEDGPGMELVLTHVQQDVYGACLLLTVRGLYERKLGTILMAWAWVLLVVAINLFICWTLHDFIYSDSPFKAHSRDTVSNVTVWLTDHWENNKRLPNGPDDNFSRKVIKFCEGQPSAWFFTVVHFIWSSRMLGHFSDASTLFLCMWWCPVHDHRDTTIQERNGDLVLAGLMPFDWLIFWVTLVFPKTVVAILLWFVGSEFLAITSDLGHLLFKAVSLYYISILEAEVFNNFLAHSKKEWISRAQMVQQRGELARLVVSWPGEVLKLLSAIGLVLLVNSYFQPETEVRSLCWKCVHTCTAPCSEAFNYCFELKSWPYHYTGP